MMGGRERGRRQHGAVIKHSTNCYGWEPARRGGDATCRDRHMLHAEGPAAGGPGRTRSAAAAADVLGGAARGRGARRGAAHLLGSYPWRLMSTRATGLSRRSACRDRDGAAGLGARRAGTPRGRSAAAAPAGTARARLAAAGLERRVAARPTDGQPGSRRARTHAVGPGRGGGVPEGACVRAMESRSWVCECVRCGRPYVTGASVCVSEGV